MAFGSMFCCARGSNRKEQGKKQWRIFSLNELLAATNNFNYDNKLGEGAFGSVYWGQLWDGSQIAVKRLKDWSNDAVMDFADQVEILASVQHNNLLSLRGYCAEGQERLIVYEFISNMSLFSHLHGQHSTDCFLDWNRRMNIAIESAEGIAYLHHQVNPQILHGDIKANNVLLDSDFHARIGDFGLVKLIPDGVTNVSTNVKGMLGYLAPECATLRKASKSCDVYSFGILLLELASGKKPSEKLDAKTTRTITEWALSLAREKNFTELGDTKLNGNFVEEELKRVVLVALICAHSQPEKRPTMPEVVELLKGSMEEKFSVIENDEMFKSPQPDAETNAYVAAEGSSNLITDIKASKNEIEQVA